MWRIILALAVCVLLLPKALAHDPEHPELNQWYQSLHSHSGGMCCDGSDAVHLADPEWQSKDGHYQVLLSGKWVDVPESAVVDGPNKDGRAMVWPYYINGEPVVRCFMPGALT